MMCSIIPKHDVRIILIVLLPCLLLAACSESTDTNKEFPTSLNPDRNVPGVDFNSVTPLPLRLSSATIKSDTQFTIPFTERIDADTLTENNVALTNTDLSENVAINFYASDGMTPSNGSILVIRPKSEIKVAGQYTITLSGITDLAANIMPEQKLAYTVDIDSDKDGVPDWLERLQNRNPFVNETAVLNVVMDHLNSTAP